MNSCMIAHATVEEEDRARRQWFEEREGKRRQRETEAERVEERRREVVELIRAQEEKERVRGRDGDGGGKDGRDKGGGFWGSVRR